ncbi:MAG: transcriptional regulator, partial [Okeania sp. SIO4D6]|nr:transcriptional regulator [Okeania sp. SIO4D6]
PEYPYISIDEAIVNAVAHRDYAIQLPIECELYKDVFVVRNGGRILQRDQEVPPEFRLDDKIILNSMPRNPKLIEWLKIMREKGGSAFVRALSEGTKRMRDEMIKLNLPAPLYIVNPAETTLILCSNSAEREAKFAADSGLGATNEFSNLFPLKFILENGNTPEDFFLQQRRKDIISALKNALTSNAWYIEENTLNRLVAHRQRAYIPQNEKVDKIVRFYQGYSFRIYPYWNNFNLMIDLNLQVRNVQNVSKLFRDYPASFFVGKRVLARWQENWYRGNIIRANPKYTNLNIFDFKKEVQVPSNLVIPNLQDSTIEEILNKRKIKFNLSTKIEELSLENKHDAAEIRAEKIQAIAKYLSQDIFKPLIIGGMQIFMEPSPTSLSKSNRAGN